MKIIIGDVASGKTTHLILESIETKNPILVFSEKDKIGLKSQAQNLINSGFIATQHDFKNINGLNLSEIENVFPEPVVYKNEISNISRYRNQAFLIDNAQSFFYRTLGLTINSIVFDNSDKIEIKKLELSMNSFINSQTKEIIHYIKRNCNNNIFNKIDLKTKKGNYKKLTSLRNLIRKSHKLNHYIVSKDFESVENIMILSREMKLGINYPLTFSEFINKQYNENGIKGFLIENPQDLLQTISKVNISYVFEEQEIIENPSSVSVIENLANYLSNDNLGE